MASFYPQQLVVTKKQDAKYTLEWSRTFNILVPFLHIFYCGSLFSLFFPRQRLQGRQITRLIVRERCPVHQANKTCGTWGKRSRLKSFKRERSECCWVPEGWTVCKILLNVRTVIIAAKAWLLLLRVELAGWRAARISWRFFLFVYFTQDCVFVCWTFLDLTSNLGPDHITSPQFTTHSCWGLVPPIVN